MDKLYVEDLPTAIEKTIAGVRDGLRKTRDDNVALVQVPDKIDLDFTLIIRKDDLVRSETTARDPTTTTIVSGAAVDTDTRVTTGNRVTDETEAMTSTRTGGESGGETGGETGGQSGGQSVSHADSGGELETYQYVEV